MLEKVGVQVEVGLGVGGWMMVRGTREGQEQGENTEDYRMRRKRMRRERMKRTGTRKRKWRQKKIMRWRRSRKRKRRRRCRSRRRGCTSCFNY
jgi:hypothetical protein